MTSSVFLTLIKVALLCLKGEAGSELFSEGDTVKMIMVVSQVGAALEWEKKKVFCLKALLVNAFSTRHLQLCSHGKQYT